MARLRGKTFDRENIGKLMRSVCPSDAEQDLEMQRLLDRMGGDPEKEKREP